jgi:hypothetical protein
MTAGTAARGSGKGRKKKKKVILAKALSIAKAALIAC